MYLITSWYNCILDFGEDNLKCRIFFTATGLVCLYYLQNKSNRMLTLFSVENFKNFKNKFIFDLTDTKKFTHNETNIKNNVVNKAIIYGRNGAGKSNLGYALLDLVSHLTDKLSNAPNYKHFLNASSNVDTALFEYDFNFDGVVVQYRYRKFSHTQLCYEELIIDTHQCFFIDWTESSNAVIDLEGAESLNTDMADSVISLVSYIKNNTVLANNKINTVFKKFIKFVEGMLLFRSLLENKFIGYERDSTNMIEDIIKKNNVSSFEKFLRAAGIDCDLVVTENGESKELAFSMGEKLIPFYEVASTGTKSLTLFYYWLQRLLDETNAPSFVFIDEIDAFYHHDLSALIIRELQKTPQQIIVTTHNTGIMVNELSRPDCNFVMTNEKITSMSNLTNKELRMAHNIEKMYRSGAFNG